MQFGGHLIIKMLSYKYRNSYYKDETVSQPSHLIDGNPHTWGDFLYWIKGLLIYLPNPNKIQQNVNHVHIVKYDL